MKKDRDHLISLTIFALMIKKKERQLPFSTQEK